MTITNAQSRNNRGENLIFIISLPRSGSTLLQHVLGSHSKIAATAEPWVLFPAICALRKGTLKADYNAEIGQIAFTEFLAKLDNGDGSEHYYSAVADLAQKLYGAYTEKKNAERFLDKTSRYYQFLPELFRVFPDAKYVFLVRNPLALLASFLNHMVFRDLRRLGEPGIRNDLLEGYKLIRQGIMYFGDDAVVIKYEDLVKNPVNITKMLCDKLDLIYEPGMLNYGDNIGVLPGRLVDPKSIHKHSRPVDDYVEAWRTDFESPQFRALAFEFLTYLGSELINSFSYSYKDLLNEFGGNIKSNKPVASWDLLMSLKSDRTLSQRWKLNAILLWQQQGLWAVIKWHSYYFFKIFSIPFSTVFSFIKRLPYLQTLRNKVQKLRGIHSLDLHKIKNKSVSTGHEIIQDISSVEIATQSGWQDLNVAENQLAAYQPLLAQMHAGNARADFVAAANALRLTKLSHPSLLEIGCGNGYYSEILSHLTGIEINYHGLDSSIAMIDSARKNFPNLEFSVADAYHIPFKDKSFDIAWSGTVLMHLPNYKKAIEETWRVARRFCIFHSTPLNDKGDTTFLTKHAYGVRVIEVIISKNEFEKLLHEQGLVIRHIVESLPYTVSNDLDLIVRTLTYICERQGEN